MTLIDFFMKDKNPDMSLFPCILRGETKMRKLFITRKTDKLFQQMILLIFDAVYNNHISHVSKH